MLGTGLHELDAAGTEIHALHHRLAGRVVIGAFPSAAAVLLPRVLAALRAMHGGLVLDLVEASSPSQLRQLRAGRIDVAVVAVGAGPPDYVIDDHRCDTLPSGELRIGVADGHRFAGRRRVSVAELAAEVWIVGAGVRDDPQFGAWPTLPDARIGHRARDWTARMGMVAAGMGITTIPGLAVLSVPTGVRTVEVDDPVPQHRHLLAVTAPDRTPGVRVAVEVLHREAERLRD